MKIFLLGYMGSGKSLVGKTLATSLDFDFIDLDDQLEKKEGVSISEIFAKRGEVYFRKKERMLLEDLINSKDDDKIISLGGGTPCYGDTMDRIKAADESVSFYLKLSIETLTERLFTEKDHRPMISHLQDKDKLEEFIRKHLFERGFYYNQSDFVVNCDSKTPEVIVEEIKSKLG